MILYGLPVCFALFVWWASTGVILYLDGLPQRTFRWSMAGASLLMAASVYALILTSSTTTIAGAYAGFSIGLVIWGWLELGYYMGFMMGPRREGSPVGCTGWQHFRNAAGTTLYHELAAAALAAMIAAVTWDMPNKVAFYTFVILWWMQLSAKLNVFLGVANLAEEFLPPHLAFLRSFMTRKPMNLFFPLSVTGSVVGATLLVEGAARGSGFEAAGLTMLSALMGLAILEHWFLVVPLPSQELWRWSLGSRTKPVEAPASVEAGSEPAAQRRRVALIVSEPVAPTHHHIVQLAGGTHEL